MNTYGEGAHINDMPGTRDMLSIQYSLELLWEISTHFTEEKMHGTISATAHRSHGQKVAKPESSLGQVSPS